MYNSFCIYSYGFHSIPKLLRSAPYSSTPLCMCTTFKSLSHFTFHHGIPCSPKLLFKYLYALKFIICSVKLYGFSQCLMSCIHHYSIIQSSFTALNNALYFTYLIPPSQNPHIFNDYHFVFSDCHIIGIAMCI